MVENKLSSTVDNEREIMTIVQNLPPERKAQVLAFARLLAFETFETTELDFLGEDVAREGVQTDADARWDELLASEEGQRAL